LVQLKGNEKSRFLALMFGRISRRYDLLNTLMTVGMHYIWRRNAAKLAANDISGDFLDIASGTGDFAFDLLRFSNVNLVVGLDFSPEMLDVAVVKSDDLGFTSKFLPVIGDVHTLPFPDERFSGTTVGFGVRNFSDLQKALAEIVRVTGRGGRVTVLEIVRPRGKFLAIMFLRYFNWFTPKLGRFFARDYEAYRYLPESVQHFMSAKQLASVLESVGLQDIVIRTKGMGSVAIISGVKP
jgi:demethylmenaquinone methyltransferase/2-methoxy-6-polyprenyl-1,4-benzoquinol methylase